MSTILTVDEIVALERGADAATRLAAAHQADLRDAEAREQRRAHALRSSYVLTTDDADTPELRAQRAIEPLFVDAHRRAGLHLRTPEDVARDMAAARQRSAEAEQRSAERQTNLALAHAHALSARPVLR